MAHIKNIVLACIFCMYLVMGNEAFASKNCHFKENPNNEQCTAPAPDSLRVVTIGGDFVELSWLPAWEGARQNIEVFIRTNETDWMPQYVLDSVVGTSIVLAGLDLTQEYGVKISTYCPSGELSTQSKFIDGINLIIDLAVAGRNPVNPTKVKCNDIPLTNKWIGFRVGYQSQGIQIANTFEFYPVLPDKPNSSISEVEIRRVTTNHPIVACRLAPPSIYPTALNPLIENVGTTIKLDRLINNGIERFTIGNFIVSLTSNTVSLCPDPDFPWAENHTFEALVSNNNSLNLDEIEERLSFRHEAKYIGLSYVNPIGSHATIKFDSLVNDIDVNLKIKIFDQQGKLLSEKYSHFINGILEINVEEFNSGFLIFLFTLKNAQYAIPVIKQ